MRVLFVVPYPPSRVRVRPYHLIRELAARGHHVTVATLWSSDAERAEVGALRPHVACVEAFPLPRRRALVNCLRALPAAAPLQARFCWQPALAARLPALLAEADVVHVEHLRGAPYALHALRTRGAARKPPVVWDSVDCISHLFEQAARASRSVRGRLLTRLELARTRRYEGWLAGQFDRVLVTAAGDRAALAALARRAVPDGPCPPLCVLPNGVDLRHFAPSDEPREAATVVLSGKLSYHANVTAALHLVHDIMPRVWAARPEVEVWLVGQAPPPAVRALAADPRVRVTGPVPEVCDFLRRATLAVAPMPYGAGIQNKVLEAMACGTPVVASPQAATPLRARADRDLLVAEGAEPFARALLALLDDPARRAALGRAGRAYVEAAHSWGTVGDQLEAIYWSAIED